MFVIDINCLIGVINSCSLVIFKFQHFEFDLKELILPVIKKFECTLISKAV